MDVQHHHIHHHHHHHHHHHEEPGRDCRIPKCVSGFEGGFGGARWGMVGDGVVVVVLGAGGGDAF